MPMRSPAPMFHSKGLMTSRPPKLTAAFLRLMTFLPRRLTALRRSSMLWRTGGSLAMSSSAASLRNFGLVPRAWGWRASQASSLRRMLRRLAAATAAWRSRSTRCWM